VSAATQKCITMTYFTIAQLLKTKYFLREIDGFMNLSGLVLERVEATFLCNILKMNNWKDEIV
jgi:hypothetical protein